PLLSPIAIFPLTIIAPACHLFAPRRKIRNRLLMLHLVAQAAPHVDDSIQSDSPQLPVVGRNLLYDALKCFQRPFPSLEGRAAAVVIAEFFHLPLTLGRHELGQPAAHGILCLLSFFKTRLCLLAHGIGEGLPPIQNQGLTKPHISSGQVIVGRCGGLLWFLTYLLDETLESVTGSGVLLP